MNSNLMQCDDSKLKLLLAANDHDAEHDPWMHHVEQCSQCQSRLRELAAADDQWQKAAEVLATEEDDVSCFRGEHETTPNWNEAMVKQLLDPPSHPEMLGRLGRYEMERMIGSGGMGIVFKAFDTELNRVVAIKLLAPYLAARSSARKRFAREARAAAGVRDDHVVPIFNVESEHEPPFLVMQYVAGGSLQEKLDRDGPLEVAEVLRIGLQTAKGLAAAHAQGLIHRDVKPSNILLDEGVERALLTDFGLARAEDDACLTRSGFHPGTPHYMSPEQVRGDAIDGRSDLFSLGCVLYTLCTGRSPFRADTSYAVMRRITDEIPRPIRELNADIPQWLESIVMKLLSKTRDDRFSSADKVAELLEDCLAHVQEPTTRPLPASVAELVKDSFSADTGSKPTGLSGGFRFPPIRKLITAAAFAFIAFAGTIIYLETGKGTLRIESQADDVPIRIVRGNEVVEELTVSQSGQSVRIAAGTYEVEIGGEIDGLLLDKGKVVLSRGENEVVRIARTSGETAQVSGTPIVAPVPFDAPFQCRVRWGEGIYENAFVKKGELIGEVVEFDTDLLEQTENQLSAAKNQVNSMQAAVQANESNLSATETIIETLARQREAYEEVKSQIETAAAATLASAKNRIEAKKAELAEQAAVQEQTQTNFARQQELFEEALISKLQYQAAEHGVKVAGARVKKAQADIQSAENDLIARQSEDQAKKAKAQVDVDLAISSVDKAKGDAARAERELAKARRDLKQAQKTVVELETKLARQRKLLIHAPFSGFVTQLGNRIVNEGDRICLLSPEAADTQPAGKENASPGARGASDDVTISTLTEAPLGKITETLRAVFALGKRFQEIQTKLHAAVEGEESEQTIATLEEKKAAVRSERDMIVAILEAQLEAAEKRKESQTTVRQSVKLGVQQGLLDPPGLPAAELAVVMTAAEIRQLELLIQHCRSLGIDEVTASQDEKRFALSILSVRLEAEQKNHRFHMDRSTLAKRLFDLGDRDLYDVQEAEQAEAEVAAEVRKLEVLIEAYQNERPNSIGLPPSLEQGTSISATPTIEEATRQFNLQSATDRETLFDPPIGELSVQQLRDAFAKTANEYREIGEHTIADSLQRIAETGQLPSDALSPVYASGPYGKDKDGKLTQKQIVPMLMLPDGRGGARLVPLRSAELIYNKHGRSSKRYGDLFEESQQTSADGSDKKTGIEDRNTQNDSVSEELANAGESLAARAAMAVTKEGRQVLTDAVPGKLADRLVAAAGSPTWKLHHVDKLPTVLADDSLGYRITLRRTWEEYSSLPQQKETPPDERGPFELKHEDWEFVLFSRERQDAGRRSDASTPAANASRLAQSWLEVPGLKIIWKTASSPYHTQAVCMGEGHGFVWYSLGTLFGQETIREKLKLIGGDDRIDLLIAGTQIEDEGNITTNSCQQLMERFGDEALGRIETAIEKTQEPNALRRLIGALAFIRTDAATKLLMQLHKSDNKDINTAADYALIHRPLRPAAKSAYLDMLLQHRHVDVACEGCIHFRWKEALPILVHLTSHPKSLRELSWTIPARRELERKAIEYELIGAKQTIIAGRTDPNYYQRQWETLVDSDDLETIVLTGIELATYTTKGPQQRVQEAGIRLLLTRPRNEVTDYLQSLSKAMPAENAKQVQQLLHQLKQSEQLKRLQSHGILVTPGGIGGASHRYVVPSEFRSGHFVISDLLHYCVNFSPKSEIVFFGPVITDDQFRQFHLLLPESHVRRMAAVWLNIVATVSDDERERNILRVSGLGSPAREIGLQVDDVIVGIGPFRWPKSESRDAFNAAMLSQIPGQQSKIVVDRDGKLLTFPVTWEESTAHRLLCDNAMPTTKRDAIQSAKPDVDEASTTNNIQGLTGKWQATEESRHLLDSKLVEANQTGFVIAIDKQFGDSYRKTSDTYENQYREFLEQKGHSAVVSGTIKFDYGGESELMISRKDGGLYLWYGVVTGGNPRIFLLPGADMTSVESLAIQWTSSCSDSPLDSDTDSAKVVYQRLRPTPPNQTEY